MKLGQERRRSPRLTLEVPVYICWRDPQGVGHSAKTRTAVVGHHGALLYLSRPLEPGQGIRIVNRTNEQAVLGRVIWGGAVQEGGSAWVGVELDSPVGDEFWGPMAVRLWEERPRRTGRTRWLAWLRAGLRSWTARLSH